MKITILNLQNVKKYKPQSKAILIRALDKFENDQIENRYVDSIELYFADIDFELSDYAIQEEDAKKIKEFVEKYKDSVDEIVVHCSYAQGRSPAIGYVLSLYFNQEFDLSKYPDINNLVIKKLKEEMIGS